MQVQPIISNTANLNFYSKDEFNEYIADFQNVLGNRESKRFKFGHRAPQISQRPTLVAHIKYICSQKQLSYCTLQLAVYLLDLFMDGHSIKPETTLLVANACLLLAAKHEENSSMVPKISELHNFTNDMEVYNFSDYRRFETIVFRFFSWDISFPTAAHCIHFFMNAPCSLEEFHSDHCKTFLTNEMYEFIKLYLDKIVDDFHYMQYFQPSILAAGIISIARQEIGLICWTEKLQILTQYTFTDLEDVINALRSNDYFQTFCCTEAPNHLI